jgi:hypothetical protein
VLSLLFDEWAARVARGERPDPREYLARAGAFADELARVMDAYLVAVPRREPTEETVELARAWVEGHSPLVELRARQGLRRDEVVDAIVGEFSLRDEQRATVKEYYHRLEAGLLDPARLSRPLLDLLARVLGAAAEQATAWRPRRLQAAPAFRANKAAGSAFAPARAQRADVADDAEVAALFLSGR